MPAQMEDAASLQKQGDDDLNPSEYLAKHVYPVLEPAIVELLKAAFPADFKEFVRRASVAAEETQLLELQKQQEDKAAEVKGNEDGEAEAPPAEEEKEEKPAQPEAEKPLEPEIRRRVSQVSQVSVQNTVPVSKARLRPVLWLAQYLKERNKQNTADREEAKRNSALELASTPAEDIETVHANLIASVKQLLWPCSVYIATRDTIVEQVPKPVDPAEEAAKQAEGEEGEEEAEAEAEEEGEDGEEKPPKEPAMMDVDVPILRYIACSHPSKETITGRSLRLDSPDCISGRALQTRDPVFIADVAAEAALHFFPPEPDAREGSFLAVSFTRTPEDTEPYAVLSLDTLLDRRALTNSDVEMALRLARAAEAVAHTVPLPPPPPVEEPPGEDEEAPEGDEEAEEEEEG